MKMNETQLAAIIAEIAASSKALANLADALSKVIEGGEVKDDGVKEEAKPEKVEKKYTFEEVRTLLTLKSREGKTEAVRELLKAHGAATLSALKEEDYAEVMKIAEGL